MKVLTILQPYAALIMLGEKHFETRSMRCHYSGPLLIHAGKDPRFLGECRLEPIRSILHKHGITRPGQLLFGFALGTVQLAGCYSSESLLKRITPTERLLGNYLPGRWGWEMRGARRLDTAFPLRGQQGLFDWDPPPGFAWNFRDPDPDAPPEPAKPPHTLDELRAKAGLTGPAPKYRGYG